MTAFVGEGELAFPYRRSVGEALSKFLTALRDDAVILGRRCGRCHLVVVPALEYCDICSAELDDWIPLGPDGTVTGLTRMPGGLAGAPLDGPVAVVRVRLDGADVDLVHLSNQPAELRVGSRVRPAWRDERTGSIADILTMEMIG